MQIKADAGELERIASGDAFLLRTVLERTLDSVDVQLRQQATADTFRFYQGAAQCLEAVVKILPTR